MDSGYRKVRIKPVPNARIRKAELTYLSASGRYVANWEITTDGKLAFHYEIPFDCEAEVELPETGEILHLSSGFYDYLLEPKQDYRRL